MGPEGRATAYLLLTAGPTDFLLSWLFRGRQTSLQDYIGRVDGMDGLTSHII